MKRLVIIPLIALLTLALGVASAVAMRSQATPAAAAKPTPSVLLGTQAVQPTADSNGAGNAQAFSVTDTTPGAMTSLSVYVGSGNAAKILVVGLYANAAGSPGALLAHGSIASPKSSAWNTVSLSTSVTAGNYWVAILGLGGTLTFRDQFKNTNCSTQTSAQNTLSALPASWTTGTKVTGYCPVSAYASGTATTTKTTTTPTGTTTTGTTPTGTTSTGTIPTGTTTTGTTPTGTTTTTTPPPTQTNNCAGAGTSVTNTASQAALDACGFPSMNSTGPAAGTTYTNYPQGLGITAPGTYNGLNVTGGISVQASNVTIDNSIVTDANNQSQAIFIGRGVTNVTIENTSIHGTSANGSGALASAVENIYGTTVSGLVLNHVQFYNGDRILTGYGTVENSYCMGGATFGTEHDECVYTSGAAPGLNLQHDTLVNANPYQTAAVFVDSPGAGGYGGNDGSGSITINDSLLAGGGYCVYGGNGGSGHTGPESITNNRFATLFYSTCGQFGTNAYMPSDLASSGNVWDAAGQALRLG